MLVASHYRPQQSLIGPVWFPAYIFVLKIVGLCYVLPSLVVSFDRSPGPAPWIKLGCEPRRGGRDGMDGAFVAAGVVTLIFVLLQLSETRTHFLERWNARHLPPIRDPYKIPLSNSIAELVINLAFLFWWMAYASSPFLFVGSIFKLSLAPVRVYFFWGYLAIALFNIAARSR